MPSSGRELHIPKAWRSECSGLIIFFIACVCAVALSRILPWTVITGKLAFGYTLTLPLFSLVPVASLGTLLFRIYDVRYLLSERGIESQVGILALNKNVASVRYEDIRYVDVRQTVVGRMFDFGDIEIGTAGTDGIEVSLGGVAAPYDIREVINAEVDKRQKLALRQKGPAATAMNVD